MRARRLIPIFVASFLALGVASIAPSPSAATKGAAKETPLKVSAALTPKLTVRMVPFTFGMTTTQVFKTLDDRVDAVYADKISAASSQPKLEARLDKEKESKKKALRDKLSTFVAGKGVSGYEMVTPGEFTYSNGESVLEVARDGGGTRCLFFMHDRLYKIYDVVALEKKDGELGETWDAAVAKLEASLGEKGKRYEPKATLASYYGTLIAVPAVLLWSDGTTQVRLVDHTHREDSPTRQVGLVYEEIATVDKLPTYRTKLESKQIDASVERAGAPDPLPPPKKKK